ncbi:hypothetical protein [Amorphus orientalis]|uniref:Transferrin-binding protein B C-lobe/N-lobe beta barrel domain-containing protein n=1 Tax=Amorphus orientalis TaxID=649198 RepID=A0AAE3VMZ3_9HYPH|nr:hypothetical protein [Amorphus orientalis]MDQ0315017.1 hypothetical protein [Amorphus orientalis]
MKSFPASLAATGTLAVLLVPACALAQSPSADLPALDALGPGQYSLWVSGAAEAEATTVPVTTADASTPKTGIISGEASQRARYTYDDFAPDATNETGPFVISMALGSALVEMEGVDNPGVTVGLHVTDAVEPGMHAVEEAFFDVGPSAVPLAVSAVAGPLGGRPTPFASDPEGAVEIVRMDRDGATGRFALTMGPLMGDGDAITVRGAFKGIPYAPGLEASISGSGKLEGPAFDTVKTDVSGAGPAFSLSTGFHDEPAAHIAFSEEPEIGTYEPGNDGLLTARVNGEPAAGSVTITRTGESYGAEFDLRADAEGAGISGSFDHARPE